jgi:hypothetical protein
LEDLALPETVVAELEGRLRSQHKLLSKIVGVRFPPLFGCRTPAELCRVRGLGQALALAAAWGFAQTCLAQATAALGAGGHRAALASWGAQEPGDPEPLAMDMGVR